MVEHTLRMCDVMGSNHFPSCLRACVVLCVVLLLCLSEGLRCHDTFGVKLVVHEFLWKGAREEEFSIPGGGGNKRERTEIEGREGGGREEQVRETGF